MYLPLSDDKHRFVRDSFKKSTLEIQDNVRDKIQSEKKIQEFFPPQKQASICPRQL